jgi:hypothetical protein
MNDIKCLIFTQSLLYESQHRVQTGSGDHPTSYPSDLLGVKRPDRENNQSPPSSAEFKNIWSYTFTPYVFMVWYLVKHGDIFTFKKGKGKS